jgi:hypothetical protein
MSSNVGRKKPMEEPTMQDIVSFTIPDPSPGPMQDIVTFTIPDLPPDTKLEIYDRTFEVHSMVLRLHSGFFRKFLAYKKGSSDESNSDSGFRHHFVVKDDGDVWGFQPVEHVGSSLYLPIENCLRPS